MCVVCVVCVCVCHKMVPPKRQADRLKLLPYRYDFQLQQVVGFKGLEARIRKSAERIGDFDHVLRVR